MPAYSLAEEAPASETAEPAENSEPAKEGEGGGEKKEDDNPLAKAVQARTPEAQAMQSGFQLITALDHYLGTGTFLNPDSYASLTGILTVVPQYLFGIGGQRLVLSGVFRFVYEYTMPDAATGRRYGFWDTAVTVSAPAVLRVFKGAFDGSWKTGISLTPSVGVTLPTSHESIYGGMIMGVRAGVTLSSSVDIVDFRLVVNGTRNIHAQRQSGFRNPDVYGGATRDGAGNLLAACRAGEQFCGQATNNVEWALSAGGQIQVRATGSLLLYAGYTYMHMWRYAAAFEPDEYTSPVISSNGEPAAKPGGGRFDRTSTFVGASYQVNEHYSVDLGVSTVQTPLMVDKVTGKWVPRFPFFATVNTADNATSIYFTFTAAY